MHWEFKCTISGDTLPVSDHQGKFNPLELNTTNHLILLAAGTGFTPMVKLCSNYLQVAAAAGSNGSRRRVTFCFFNTTEADIMWRDQLEALAAAHPETLSVHHALSQADDSWSGARGRISTEMLESFIGAEKDPGRSLACICGPNPFVKSADRYANST